ncbi:MAG: 4Fe-4S binding protein [Polyangiaceae bacterium]|nr:4Fe-4S binding protein [Polyangiaceae bacterium]
MTGLDSSGAAALDLLATKAMGGACVSDLPPERDVTDEPQRIGIFLCGCDGETSGVIDLHTIVAYARSLPFVACAVDHPHLCEPGGRALIASLVAEHRLNRVVVVACTPSTHERYFRDVVRQAGLNRHLLTLVNLRSGCAWVHASTPAEANAKARDLVTMAAYRAACSESLPDRTVPTVRASLVVGGRVAGIAAALALAERGIAVHLVERANRLADGLDSASRPEEQANALAALIRLVSKHRRITLHLGSELIRVNGQVGHFVSHLRSSSETTAIEHGVIVVDLESTQHASIPLQSDGACPDARTRLAPTELASAGVFASGDPPERSLAEAMARAHTLSAKAASLLGRRATGLDLQAVRVDSTKCARCLTCLRICPQHAPRAGYEGKSEIQEALCVACGTCVSSCPARALSLPGHTDAQIQAAVRGLLHAEPEPFASDDQHTQQPGISWPRWHTQRATRVTRQK